MFTKNSVSQSMIDAVQSVLAEDKKLLLEPEVEKKDRKKNDDKKQDVAEGHQDDSKEREENLRYSRSRNPVADAIRKKLNPNQKEQNKKEDVSEELKGNQVKLDKNHNGKLDSQDFKLLRMKKESILDSMKSGAKKVAKKVVDTVGHKDDEDLLKDLEKETGGKRPNAYNKPKNEEVESVEEDVGAMMSVVDEDKGKKAIRVDTLKGPTTTTDPEVKNANAHFSGKKATLKAEGKTPDTPVPFVTDSVSPTHREINKAVKPTFKKIKEMLGKTGTGESELPANAQLPG